MSVQAMAWVFDHSKATLGTRLVALSVANHADKTGRNAWASVTTYAEEAHLSKRQAQYALRALVDSGELRKTGSHGPRADRQTAIYEFCGMVDAVRDLHLAPDVHGVQSATSRGAESGIHGVQPIAPKPTTNHPGTVELARKPRERDPIFDALAEIEGLNLDEIDADTGRRLGVARAKLARACEMSGTSLTPGEIIRRAANYPSHFGDATLTAGALVKWWPRLGAPGRNGNGRGSGAARTLQHAAELRERGE